MSDTSKRLREERVRLEYTQAALAKVGGVLVNTQYKHEESKRSRALCILLY